MLHSTRALQFKHILVDEFQDTNIAQYELLKLLTPPKDGGNLTVVGDDSQSIYKFRGAAISNILHFIKTYKKAKTVIGTLKLIEKKTNENPIQVLVRAIENASPRDEITVIEYGGARYPQAVDVSPLRRVTLAIKYMVHGASDKAFNKKATISETLAHELTAASEGSNESFAMSKKNETEKMADSAR